MHRIYGYHYETPVGILGIAVKDEALCRISFGRLSTEFFMSAEGRDTPEGYTERECTLHREAKRQLDEYFSGKRRVFELPLRISGTAFQMRVWEQLRKIPYGEIRSYKEIAVLSGSPKGCRAVGMANRCNPIPIIIPCHRVIGSSGKLVGFMGGEKRIELKEQLLALEREGLKQESTRP